MIGVDDFIKFWVSLEKGKICYTETKEMSKNRQLFESALHKFLEHYDYKEVS